MAFDLAKWLRAGIGIAIAIHAGSVRATEGPRGPGCAVLLVPGAFGARGTDRFLSASDYFAEYATFFRSKGCDVLKVEFPPDVSVEVSANILRSVGQKFVREHAGKAITLIAHSQGALDARYALKSLKLAGVKNLVMIGAPNRGTPIATWVVEQRESRSAYYWILKWFARYDLSFLNFAGESTPAFLEKHEPEFAETEGVRYGAVRTVCQTHCYPLLRLLSWWMGVGPGDGMIPVTSQVMGEDLGEFDLDHLSEVGVDPAKHSERARLFAKIWDWMGSPAPQ